MSGTLKPLPGKAIIKREGQIQNAGILVIPDAYKPRIGHVGTVLAITLDDKQARMKTVPKIGDRVLLEAGTGQEIAGTAQCFMYRVKHILGIIPPSVKVNSTPPAVGRCPWCGSAAGDSHNVMTVPHLGLAVCPRCNRDQYGRTHDWKDSGEATADQKHLLTQDVRKPHKPKTTVLRP